MSRIGNIFTRGCFVSVAAMAFSAGLCLSGGSAAGAAPATGKPPGGVGLGAVLTSEDGEQIFGFDIDQSGSDGVLATGANVETFDQNTGKIRRSFGKYLGPQSDYVVDGIAGGDVALIEVEKVPQGKLYPHRHYELIDPVAGANRFTGTWTPPLKGLISEEMANDQTSQTSLLFALTSLKSGEAPELIVSDVAANTFSNVIPLDPNLLCLCDGPQLGLYTAGNEAVFALSPDGGAVGGDAPVNLLINLTTGNSSQFNGYNNGFYHAGSVNGLAVDPSTGIAATTTELNSQVEFYDLNKQAGITFVQLPCTGNTDQTNSGTGVAVDPVNQLFLVADPFYCDGTQGGAIVVYDEAGNYVESITGFNLALGEPAPVLNPGKRMGWAFSGPDGFDQLQQFFY